MTIISNLDVRNELKRELLGAVRTIWQRCSQTGDVGLEIKEDGSPLTLLDKEICRLLESKIKTVHPDGAVGYYSEEKRGVFTFPTYVVDPIDGTREFVDGRAEFAISIAYLNSADINDEKNCAWILNPLTGFEITTNDLVKTEVNHDLKLGLVSRSEWKSGDYQDDKFESLKLSQLGSIAYKLGLLAAGACDFVISKRPKSIWDIAAGVILLNRLGFKFYENLREVTHLRPERVKPPLIWCRSEHLEQIKREFKYE